MNRSIFTCLLATAATLAIYPTQALAGGPSWLRLPVDGITKENQEDCAKLFREKLKPHIMQSSYAGHQVAVKDGYVQMPLAAKPLSLADIQGCLKGSAFSIPSDQLIFDGVVRLEIDTTRDLRKLSSDLRSGPSIEVTAKGLAGGGISILIESPRRNSTPLLSYQELKHIVSKQGGKIIDVTWGADSDTYGEEDFIHWFCGDAFGALRSADVRLPAVKTASNAKAG